MINLDIPCDVGDKIYVILGNEILTYTVDDFVYDGTFIWCHASNPNYCSEHRSTYRCISFDLGKTIFLNKIEAERKTALKH